MTTPIGTTRECLMRTMRVDDVTIYNLSKVDAEAAVHTWFETGAFPIGVVGTVKRAESHINNSTLVLKTPGLSSLVAAEDAPISPYVGPRMNLETGQIS